MRYRIEFIDHGGHAFSAEAFEAEDDAEAIRTARRLFTSGIGKGFEVRRDGVFVYGEQPNGSLERKFPIADYMVCFYSAVGTLLGRLGIAADSDDEALDIAAAVFDACSDLTAYHEVWKGSKPLRKGEYFLLAPTASELSERTQHIVLEREIALRESQWHIADSRRLLERIDGWTAEMNGV